MKPMERMPRRNEKSFFVVNTTRVNPPKSNRVKIPAVGSTSGELKWVAISRIGAKITDSAITYRLRPAYCIVGEAALEAKPLARRPRIMNPPRIMSQPKRMAITLSNISAMGELTM